MKLPEADYEPNSSRGTLRRRDRRTSDGSGTVYANVPHHRDRPPGCVDG